MHKTKTQIYVMPNRLRSARPQHAIYFSFFEVDRELCMRYTAYVHSMKFHAHTCAHRTHTRTRALESEHVSGDLRKKKMHICARNIHIGSNRM